MPFAEGHSAVVVYRNLLGDYGVDYLLTHPTWGRPRHIARWEGDWTGGVLTWDELRHIVDSPTTEGITDHAARLLLLTPLLDLLDVHEPPAEQAAARLSTALTAIGAPQDTAPITAQHLLACCAKGIWHDPTWTAPPNP
ncbi:hypothetical protein [Actinomadura rudentiformis]|uniref:hypothetical protein n=1 Tax=Actinomadura rudentiformis TaxID=359158 RepID=UPI001CEF8AE9|nr:hypothetical protein [Actinomadura rudentiformis]